MAVYWVTLTESYKVEADSAEEARDLLERYADGEQGTTVRHKDTEIEIEEVA